MAMLFFEAQKKSGEVKEIKITEAQYFVPVAILNSPTHRSKLNVLFAHSSIVHPYSISMVMRVALEDWGHRQNAKKIILPTHAKRMMQAVMKGWIKQLIVVIHD